MICETQLSQSNILWPNTSGCSMCRGRNACYLNQMLLIKEDIWCYLRFQFRKMIQQCTEFTMQGQNSNCNTQLNHSINVVLIWELMWSSYTHGSTKNHLYILTVLGVPACWEEMRVDTSSSSLLFSKFFCQFFLICMFCFGLSTEFTILPC